MRVLGGTQGFLTGDLEDIVILDVMDDLILPQGRYPESFVFISLFEVCQEWGVLHGGTWSTLRVPDRRHGGQRHSWCHGWPFLIQTKIRWKFCVDIFIRSVSRMGGLHGVTWNTLRVPDRRLGGPTRNKTESLSMSLKWWCHLIFKKVWHAWGKCCNSSVMSIQS